MHMEHFHLFASEMIRFFTQAVAYVFYILFHMRETFIFHASALRMHLPRFNSLRYKERSEKTEYKGGIRGEKKKNNLIE